MVEPTISDNPRTTRRTVVRGAAWTVPVIAGVAPAAAFAASPCGTTYSGSVTFTATGNYTQSSTTAGTAIVTPTPATDVVTVSFSSAVTSNYTRSADNFQKGSFVTGELTVAQTRTSLDSSSGSNQTVTITFSRPVTNVNFAIEGFSRAATNSYIDTVYTAPAPTTSSNGADNQGAGTTGNPFKPKGVSTVFTGAQTTSTVSYAGPLTVLQIVYWDSATVNDQNEQAIGIGQINFNVAPIGC